MLPNPAILINALVLKEAKASSEIENIITTDDKLYRALTVKGQIVDTATKEVLRYRQALYTDYHFIKQKGFLSTNGILQISRNWSKTWQVSVGSPVPAYAMTAPTKLFPPP